MNIEYNKVGQFLIDNKITISAAESITGGYFSYILTKKENISKVFKGSIVSYTNEIKERVLNISNMNLKNNEAISKETAFQMAENIRKYFQTDLGISFTGNAGPNPIENKEIGLVYIAIIYHDEYEIYELKIKEQERDLIRKLTVFHGFELLDKFLEKYVKK